VRARGWKAGEILGEDHGVRLRRGEDDTGSWARAVSGVRAARAEAGQGARVLGWTRGELGSATREWSGGVRWWEQARAAWARHGRGRASGTQAQLGKESGRRLGWICWVGFGFGLGWVLFYFSFFSPLTQTKLKRNEFKFEFEFNPNTQTNKTMHQHECNKHF